MGFHRLLEKKQRTALYARVGGTLYARIGGTFDSENRNSITRKKVAEFLSNKSFFSAKSGKQHHNQRKKLFERETFFKVSLCCIFNKQAPCRKHTRASP